MMKAIIKDTFEMAYYMVMLVILGFVFLGAVFYMLAWLLEHYGVQFI